MKGHFYILIILFLISCGQSKWNETNWKKTSDIGQHPYRERMVDDLLANQKLKGLHYNELIQKLGTPDFFEPEEKAIYYGISENHGSDIDPTGGRSLQFKFNGDSIITDFRISDSGK